MSDKTQVKIRAKCISCGSAEYLTEEQIAAAQEVGVAMSSCCRAATVVERCEVSQDVKPPKL